MILFEEIIGKLSKYKIIACQMCTYYWYSHGTCKRLQEKIFVCQKWRPRLISVIGEPEYRIWCRTVEDICSLKYFDAIYHDFPSPKVGTNMSWHFFLKDHLILWNFRFTVTPLQLLFRITILKCLKIIENYERIKKLSY